MNLTFTNHLGCRYTFVHVPKVAGKSISAYIYKHASEYWTPHELSHATPEDLQSLGAPLGETFAVTRNPYSRAVSLYRYLHKVNIKDLMKKTDVYLNTESNLDWHERWNKENRVNGFGSFCTLLPYVPLGCFQSDYRNVDRLFCFEQMDQVNTYLKRILGTTEDLMHLNKTGDNDYINYYSNQHTIEQVHKAYKQDFKLLGYSKDINIMYNNGVLL